jgi:pimeloyl-ACP methyl ester carboxylesterase
MVSFPEPTMVKTNGIDMAVYEAGPKNGFPVVLCHGFPELAYSWRHQLPALAAAGYRAIAPDQRGYGRTSRPEKIEDYDMLHLTGDLTGMLDALGLEKAVFVGHDWGGLVVWQLPLVHPDRVAGVIGINTPFLSRPPIDPIMGMKALYGEDMYIVYFQKPGEADAVLAKDVGRVFRFFMRKNGITAEAFAQMPEELKRFALVKALEMDETLWPGELLLTPEELNYFVETFTRTGFTGGINWYRNFDRNWELTPQLAGAHVTVPSCFVGGKLDPVLIMTPYTIGADWLDDHRGDVIIDGAGHWVQQEKPAEVNAALLDFINSLDLGGR